MQTPEIIDTHPDDMGVYSLLWECEREAFKLPDKLSVSEWCNENIVLSPEFARESGPYRWQRTPYVKDLLDLYARPSIRHMVLKFATQTTKTQFAYNLITYIIDQDPYPTILMYPSDDECKVISRTRLQPQIEACMATAAKIPADRTKYQLQEMHFPGMILYLVSGHSVTGMAQRPARNLIRDEINKYPDRIGEHGSPLELSEERVKSFQDVRKIIDVSSPTTEEGNITLQENKCQVILEYYVPCPHCRRLQVLRFKNDKCAAGEKYGMVVYQDRQDLQPNTRSQYAKASAHYICEFCKERIEDRHKDWMLARENGAGWYPAGTVDPEPSADSIEDLFSSFEAMGLRLESVAARLSSLYSPWITFGDMAAKFLDAHLAPIDRYDKLRRFTNDWLGIEWKETVTETTADNILRLKGELPPLIVPEQAIALVAGIDCQKRGYYYSVWAFASDMTAWMIRYGYLLNWHDIEQLMYKSVYRVDGKQIMMGIWRGGIDTGGGEGTDDADGSMTEQAYRWLAVNGGSTVFGVKGSSRPIPGKMKFSTIGTFPGSREPIPGAGLMLWSLDTDYFKDMIFSAMAQEKGTPGCVHLHNETDIDFAAQLASEEKKPDKRGRRTWQHVRGENHYLDTTVYAWAMANAMCLGGISVLGSERAGVVRADAAKTPRQDRHQEAAAAPKQKRAWW